MVREVTLIITIEAETKSYELSGKGRRNRVKIDTLAYQLIRKTYELTY